MAFKLMLLLALPWLTVAGQNYAVLVAGSRSWFNYRHQADICHAYQILIKQGGFPAKNVVVMAYDDIANNEENPYPGNMINKPNGPNVYAGCEINYKGEEVTAANFLKVLENLPSTSKDNVFIYYSDHGAVGLVAMPTGKPLYAKDFLATLKTMHSNQQYAQMAIYIEACESGSMLENLDKDMKIFGTTAARNNESSYAWYFDESRKVYLGDEYSVKWMENSEATWSENESLETQFKYLVETVVKSHPQQYGDMSFDTEGIQDFQAFEKAHLPVTHRPVARVSITPEDSVYPAVDSRDVKLMTLRYQLEMASRSNNATGLKDLQQRLENEELARKMTDERFHKIVEQTVGKSNNAESWFTKYTTPKNYDCLKSAYDAYEDRCGGASAWSDYALKYVRSLVNLCESSHSYRIVEAIYRACDQN